MANKRQSLPFGYAALFAIGTFLVGSGLIFWATTRPTALDRWLGYLGGGIVAGLGLYLCWGTYFVWRRNRSSD